MGFVHFYDDVDRVKELFVQKLASSGITPEQAVTIGMKPLLGKSVSSMGYWRKCWLPGLFIGYTDPWTAKPVLRNGIEMHRVRALVELEGTDFVKYLQPPRSGAAAYFPAVDTIDWPAALGDPTVPLIVTEGELKAAKACLEGFLTIALGGVWNFKVKGGGEASDRLLPELLKIAWTGRKVIVIFDSDTIEKPGVLEALRRLANLLIDAGALVFQVTLPPNGNGKVGLDDLLITKGSPRRNR